MTQVNVLEAKNNLSRLIHLLESGDKDNIIISRNGVPIVQMTLLPKTPKRSIIGAAKKDGDFSWPENFNELDDEIADNLFFMTHDSHIKYYNEPCVLFV